MHRSTSVTVLFPSLSFGAITCWFPVHVVGAGGTQGVIDGMSIVLGGGGDAPAKGRESGTKVLLSLVTVAAQPLGAT